MIDCSHGKTSSVTRRDRGGGCSIPLPVSPSPTRGDSSSIHCRGRDFLQLVSGENSPKNPVSVPRTRPPSQSPFTARPLWRGREEAAERAGSVLALQDLSIVTTGKHVLPGTWPLLHPGTGLRTTVDNVTLHPPEDARPTARRGGDPGRLIFQV